ncbi:MAG: hypothetical protein SF066_09985 [Thermoanaerobaculia bacterium]|nr:hypothetical protein [Thermoanaerobaculia bacterium]
MTSSEILTALVTALLLGILIGWLWRRIGEKKRFAKVVAGSATPQLVEIEGQLARLRAELEATREEAEGRLGELEGRLARAAAENAELHQLLHGRDEEITHLHAELAQLNTEKAFRRIAPETEAVAPRPTPAAPEGPPRDDLKAIFGIGPVLERLLNHAGITTYRQIAAWTPADVAEITGKLSVFPDRIERDRWIEGAKNEHYRKYGERV